MKWILGIFPKVPKLFKKEKNEIDSRKDQYINTEITFINATTHDTNTHRLFYSAITSTAVTPLQRIQESEQNLDSN